MSASDPRLPQARTADLLVRELPTGELMVYDTLSHQTHALNRSAALIWCHCDGQNEPGVVAERLQQELGLPAELELVWQAVARLQKAKLLGEGQAPETVSRRALVRKLGLAAGLAALVPLIDSISAPAAADATSGAQACVPSGQPCDIFHPGACCSKCCKTTGSTNNGPFVCC